MIAYFVALRFNNAQKESRTSVEDSIGMWKGRWAILEGVLCHSPLKAGEIITATACLQLCGE